MQSLLRRGAGVWLNGAVLKTAEDFVSSVGSNPTPSAISYPQARSPTDWDLTAQGPTLLWITMHRGVDKVNGLLITFLAVISYSQIANTLRRA